MNQRHVFPHGLKFQNGARFAVLIAIMAFLTITLSVKAGFDNPLSGPEAKASAIGSPAVAISNWKLDEASGTTFADSVGLNDATCTAADCPLFDAAGIANGARDFDGADDGLHVPHNATLDWNNADSFSIEAWFKTTQDCSAQNKVVVGKYSSNGSWWIGCGTTVANPNVATFYLRDQNRTFYYTQGTSAIDDGEWHHVVAVRDASTSENRIYVDGVLEGTTVASFAVGFSNANALIMGYLNNNYYFDGLIDEVALYDHALTQAELIDSCNTTAGSLHCSDSQLPSIIPIPNQNAVAGQLFTYDVDATGSPAPTFSLVEPPTPADMTIDASTGVINWTPAATGTFDVTVRADNSEGFDEKSFTITVALAPEAPVLDPIANQTATADSLFTYTASATGNPTPTFSLVKPPTPADMTINASTGVINWTPETAGTFTVTVRATNSVDFDDETFTVTVSAAPAVPVINPIPGLNAAVGAPFTYDVNASGYPAPTYSLVAPVPAGMTINASSGVINWTPAATGTFNVTVRATNSAGSDDESFTINVTQDFELFLPLILNN